MNPSLISVSHELLRNKISFFVVFPRCSDVFLICSCNFNSMDQSGDGEPNSTAGSEQCKQKYAKEGEFSTFVMAGDSESVVTPTAPGSPSTKVKIFIHCFCFSFSPRECFDLHI